MPPLILEGENLGKRHQYFNTHLNKVLKDKISFDTVLSQYEDTDLDELFKIDVASHYKQVDYIISVLKSDDMLYVSRGIKKCTWLITDDEYAHIINPHYLHSQLSLSMTTKAFSKLLLHIRLHLNDEKRVEKFYNYYEELDAAKAIKWLPKCSIEFIEKNVVKQILIIEPPLFKRLCEKHPKIYEIFFKNYPESNKKKSFFEASMYLLNSHTDMCLNEHDKLENYQRHLWPKLSKKHSAVIMKKCPDRVIRNFKAYFEHIDKKTMAKHLGRENIQEFIINLFKNKNQPYWLTYYDLEPFINVMLRKGKFEFLKKMFIDKDFDCGDYYDKPGDVLTYFSFNQESSKHIYQWYQHAPFEVAFSDLKKLIKSELSSEERVAMFKILLRTAGRNVDNIAKLLKYYHDNHINEPLKNKINFLNAVISVTKTHNYDDKSWKILDELFHSSEVYIESDYNVKKCIEAIIAYRILHNQPIPDIIEKKYKISSWKKFNKKFTDEHKEKVFKYLLNHIESKINSQPLKDQDSVNKVVTLLENIMDLLVDWDKEFVNYPTVMNKLKELTQLKYEKDITINLAKIYNKNKSWKKYMFEESLLLSRKDEVYVNALKHDATLFAKYANEVELAQRDDKVILQHFLSKLKIYWGTCLAKDWANAYKNHINESKGHRAITRGLCTLLPREELLSLFNKYAPDSSKISWSDIDEKILNIRKSFGRLMHIARPQPPLLSILPYSRGNYMEYGLPSLNAVLHNVSSEKGREYIPILLNGTVSLQKHGIQMVIAKIKGDDLNKIFMNIWKTTTNATVRAVVFQQTFKLLCQEKCLSKITDMYCLLETFIHNLSNDEYYYLKGVEVDNVPISVRANFCVKSYTYLKALPAKVNCQDIINTIRYSTRYLMDSIDSDFVEGILIEFMDEWFVTKNILSISRGHACDMISVISSYILCTTNEIVQQHRFNKIFRPFMHHILTLWDEIFEKETIIKLYFESCLITIVKLMEKHFYRKQFIVPLKVFEELLKVLELNLSIDENYLTITSVKVIVLYIQCYNKIKSELEDVEETPDDNQDQDNELFKKTYAKLCPLLAVECIELLREDMEKYFPSIVRVFSTALSKYCPVINSNKNQYSLLQRELIKDVNCDLGYILAIELLPEPDENTYRNEKELHEICKQIVAHPSPAVKLYYHEKFFNLPLPV